MPKISELPANLAPTINDLFVMVDEDTIPLHTEKVTGTAVLNMLHDNGVALASDIQNETFVYALDTGVADAYIVALTPPVSAYNDGLEVLMIPAQNNVTTAPTIDAGAGPITIFNSFGQPLVESDIVAGTPANLKYYNGNFYLQNPATSLISITPHDIQNQSYTFGGDVGLPDAYFANLTPPLSIATLSPYVAILILNTNLTTTPTLDVGFGPQPITLLGGIQVSPGDIKANAVHYFTYASGWHLINPALSTNLTTNLLSSTFYTGIDLGSTNAYSVTFNLFSSVSPIAPIYFIASASNTGPSTLSVATLNGGLGAKNITNNGNDLVGGEIIAGKVYYFIYSGSTWEIINPSNAGSISYVDETTTTRALIANQAVVADNSSLVTCTLPASASFGDVFEIIGFGSGGWLLQANVGQRINLGNQQTSNGGSLASTNQYDTVKIICVAQDTTFVADSVIGNITVA